MKKVNFVAKTLLLFEQTQILQPKIVWEEEAEDDRDPLHDHHDDELEYETYTDKPLKKKRGRRAGSAKKRPQQPATSEEPKRKRGRPRGSTNTPKPVKEAADPLVGNEIFECTGCQVEFPTKRSLTKHSREVTCKNFKTAKVTDGMTTDEEEDVEAGLGVEECQDAGSAPSLTVFLEKVAGKSDEPSELKEDHIEAKNDTPQEKPNGSSDVNVVATIGENVDDPETYTCDICDKTMTSHATLKRHIRYHNEMGRFKCDLCPLQFCNQRGLLEHYRTHTGDRPYTCPTCSKDFKLQISLKRHERTHTGERPYKCTGCSKTFALMCSLRNHARIHTGEKPYACKECPQVFATHTGRTRHMRVHTGEKRYACDFCPMRFVEGSKRNLHMRRVHTKERTVKCTACDEKFVDFEKRARHFATEHTDA